MSDLPAPRLASLTTLRLGGPPRRLVTAPSEAALIDAVREAESLDEQLLIVAGGSNLVVADDGFPGTVVTVRSRGIAARARGGLVILDVQAGEPWDAVVERTVADGLVGLESLSGIPGSTGATPIQNVGAYGAEVSQVIESVRVFDRETAEIETLPPSACGFRYRSSVFKRCPNRYVVLSVRFALRRDERSSPIRYAELARALDVSPGAEVPPAEVRSAVLHLRRGKGMLIDPTDPDSVSAGSFFLNPVLDDHTFARLADRVRDTLGQDSQPPSFSAEEGQVKTSAAWLIERAGFHRGYGNPHGIAISTRHTLALTNRGHGTSAELLRLAEEIAGGVWQRFGIELMPEPVFAGLTWKRPSEATSATSPPR